MKTVTSGSSTYLIPKIIHYIWAGGSFLMNTKSVENIAKTALKNPGFKIKIWVDEKTSDRKISELDAYYQQAFENAYKKLAQAIPVQEVPMVLEVKDIRSDEIICKQDDPIVDYELARIDPNYGASSDVLRYRILYYYGGVYQDHDVESGESSLISSVEEFEKNSQHVLYVDHLSQINKQKLTAELFNLFPTKLDQIGNDSFICTIANPLMAEFINTVVNENYRLNQQPAKLKDALKLAYRTHDLKNNTVERTGPDVIRLVIQDPQKGLLKLQQSSAKDCYKVITSQEERVSVAIKPMKTATYQLVQPTITIKPKTKFPATNLGSWLNADLNFQTYDSMEKVFNNVTKTIQFEQEYFGILRLEDHLKIIQSAAIIFNENSQETCQNFILKLKKEAIINSEKLMVVQWLGANSLVSRYYADNGLLNKTFLIQQTEDLKDIFFWSISYDFFFGAASKIYSDELLGEKYKSMWPDLFNESYTNQEIKRIYARLETCAKFLELFFNLDNNCQIEHILGVLKDNKVSLNDVLNKYLIILESAKPIFINQGISEHQIETLFNQIKNLISKINLFEKTYTDCFGLSKKAVGHFNQSNYQDALVVFNTIAEMTQNKFGDNSILLANAYYNIGSCHARKLEFDEAINYTKKALVIRVLRLGENHQETKKTSDKLNTLNEQKNKSQPQKGFQQNNRT